MKNFLITLVGVLICTSVSALNPSYTYKQKPGTFKMNYEQVWVQTEDGASLVVWKFPARELKTNSVVLISHNGEGNMADYLRRIDQLGAKHNVVIYDYRGFGESSEFAIDNNMYIYPQFQKDMEAMIDYCRKEYGNNIILYGWGIGAGLSLGVGWHRPEVKKIIADTPFLSMEDLESRFSNWDEPMEIPFAGYEKRYEPIYALDSPSGDDKRLLLIIGSNDILFSSTDMKTLQKKAQKNIEKAIYVVENPDRKDNFKLDKVAYMTRIKTFIDS